MGCSAYFVKGGLHAHGGAKCWSCAWLQKSTAQQISQDADGIWNRRHLAFAASRASATKGLVGGLLFGSHLTNVSIFWRLEPHGTKSKIAVKQNHPLWPKHHGSCYTHTPHDPTNMQKHIGCRYNSNVDERQVIIFHQYKYKFQILTTISWCLPNL